MNECIPPLAKGAQPGGASAHGAAPGSSGCRTGRAESRRARACRRRRADDARSGAGRARRRRRDRHPAGLRAAARVRPERSRSGPGASPPRFPALENGGISEDGLTYTFKIREGVTFHDGTELTADDVKFSWDRVMTMDLPEGNADTLDRHRRRDGGRRPQTFQVTLKEPNASFLNGAVVAMVASIVSQDAVEANGGVAAGAAERVHADQHGRHRALQVQRPGTAPRTSRSTSTRTIGATRRMLDVRIEIGSDPDVRVLGLRAGEFDIIETDASFVADIEGAEGVTLYKEGLLLEPIHIGLNLNIAEGALPPEDTIPLDFFHDPRVRQAFNYAFDYEAFLNGPLTGFGAFNPHYVPQGIFGYDPIGAGLQQAGSRQGRGAVPGGRLLGRGLHRLAHHRGGEPLRGGRAGPEGLAGEAQPEVRGERPGGRRGGVRRGARLEPASIRDVGEERRSRRRPALLPARLRASGRRLGRGARLRQRLQRLRPRSPS